MTITKKVAILLCTYNGNKFLRQQLDSIFNQLYTNWVLYVSDDGSTDGTQDILLEYQEKYGEDKVAILKGPGKGFAWNFVNLLEQCGSGYSYYAFSDQDDEWMPNKISDAVSFLEQKPTEIPTVHCGRTLLIDENSNPIGLSPLFNKKPSFRNALVQSIAGGNTMVINDKARDLIIKTKKWDDIISHDWWIYILITGCGGGVYYCENPTLRYRQHSLNIIGSNTTMSARFIRIKKLMDGHFKVWNEKNIKLLSSFSSTLTNENAVIFKQFIKARNAGFLSRVRAFAGMKLYRQTGFGNAGLIIAVLLKKL